VNHVRRTLLLTSAVLLLGLLAGCGQGRVKLGWVGSNLPGRFEARYAMFSGGEIRPVWADAGETLALKFEAEVNKGVLAIKVESPEDEILWDVSLREDAEGGAELPVEQKGRYVIVVRGDGTAGSFDLCWKVE
jgi:hypothetical protein